ncbi:recombinase family protein (plasmid) [Citricoccus nitrophenolicus]
MEAPVAQGWKTRHAVQSASMDRFSRSTRDLFDLVDEIAAKGAAVEFVKERIMMCARIADSVKANGGHWNGLRASSRSVGPP